MSFITLPDVILLGSNTLLVGMLVERPAIESYFGHDITKMMLILSVVWSSFGLEAVPRTLVGSVVIYLLLDVFQKRFLGSRSSAKQSASKAEYDELM